VLIADED